MIAIIFEVMPRSKHRDDYFRLAAELRSELERVDGFISVERFESLSQPGKFLSLSVWRDEEAVHRWRTMKSHREAQSAGRSAIFEDYRLRVATILRDYGMNDRVAAPPDSRRAHSPG